MMSDKEANSAPSLCQLAKGLYELYSRFGEPDELSLLDRCICARWRTTAARLDRYEEIPVDPKLLYNSGGTPGGRCKINLNFYGYELALTSTRGQIWAGIY